MGLLCYAWHCVIICVWYLFMMKLFSKSYLLMILLLFFSVIYLFSYHFFCKLLHNLLQRFSRNFILLHLVSSVLMSVTFLNTSFIVWKAFLLINICIWCYNVFLCRFKELNISYYCTPSHDPFEINIFGRVNLIRYAWNSRDSLYLCFCVLKYWERILSFFFAQSDLHRIKWISALLRSQVWRSLLLDLPELFTLILMLNRTVEKCR